MIKVVFVFIVLSLSVIFAYLVMSNKKDEEIHLTPHAPRPLVPSVPHVSARFGTFRHVSASHPTFRHASATLRLATHALPHASVCFRVFPNSRTDSYDITRYAFVRGFGWFRHGV